MNPDDFEQRLSRQPLRPVPAEWRAEVLARAGSPSLTAATIAASAPKSPARAFEPSTFTSQLREWLWPCPQACAALAAVWVLLLVLHFTQRDPASAQLAKTSVPSAMPYVWREQQKLLAELFPLEPTAPPRPRVQPAPVLPPAPRSDARPFARREEEIA